MDPPDDRYVLYGGQAGYDRLLVLSKERWPDTEGLLNRAQLAPGMRCVDVGCGGGEVTLEIAKRVAPSGHVVGLDRDEAKLALARRAATERGVSNVEFRAGSIRDWNEPSTYDAVYSRFVLQHLQRPLDVIRRMWSSLRTPGVLILEDADHSGWAVHPPNPGFDFFLRNFQEVIRRGGGDPEIGRKLYAYFRQAGLPAPEVSLAVSLRIRTEGKVMPLLTLDSVASAIVTEGLATPDEIATARGSLESITSDPDSLLCGPRIFQLLGRKN